MVVRSLGMAVGPATRCRLCSYAMFAVLVLSADVSGWLPLRSGEMSDSLRLRLEEMSRSWNLWLLSSVIRGHGRLSSIACGATKIASMPDWLMGWRTCEVRYHSVWMKCRGASVLVQQIRAVSFVRVSLKCLVPSSLFRGNVARQGVARLCPVCVLRKNSHWSQAKSLPSACGELPVFRRQSVCDLQQVDLVISHRPQSRELSECARAACGCSRRSRGHARSVMGRGTCQVCCPSVWMKCLQQLFFWREIQRVSLRVRVPEDQAVLTTKEFAISMWAAPHVSQTISLRSSASSIDGQS